MIKYNYVIILMVMALMGCDSGLVSVQSSTSGNESNDFASAQKVIQASCVSCHSEGGSAAFMPLNLSTEEDFLTAGHVVKGKPLESTLIKRLRHYGAGNSNMPPVGIDFSLSDYNKIVNWVKNISSDAEQLIGEYTCAADAKPKPDKMLRLRKSEFIASLNSIQALTDTYLVKDVTTILSINEFLLVIPEDYGGEHFNSFDQSISDDHVEAYYRAIEQFASYIAAPHSAGGNSRIKKIVTTYSNAIGGLTGTVLNNCLLLDKPSSESCYRNFIKSFALGAYRRTLTQPEIDFYYSKVNLGDTKEVVHRKLVIYMLSSPNFIFRMEDHGVSDSGMPNYKKLSGFEVASKLSYTFWGNMPDMGLFAMAISGDINTDAGFQTAMDYMFSVANQDKIKNTLKSFYGDYLLFPKIPTLNASGTPEFSSFAAGESVNVNGFAHRTDMINEVYDLLDYYTWTSPSDFSEVLKTRKYFAKTPALAKLYGDAAKIWDGSSNMSFAQTERAGLLTRVGMLATGEHLTSPIHKGVFILRRIACDDVGSPPPLSEEDLTVVYTPDMTTREKVHALTIDNKVSCASCHAKFNPFGYAFEKYDALGRHNISGENIYTAAGAILKKVPVDYATVVKFGGQDVSVSSPEELSDRLAESPLPNACYTKNLYEYIKGRSADLKNDGCDLVDINNRLSAAEGGNMLDAFKSFMSLKGFRYKKVN